MTPEQLLIELRASSSELLIIESETTDRTILDNIHAAQIQLFKAIRRAEFLSTSN